MMLSLIGLKHVNIYTDVGRTLSVCHEKYFYTLHTQQMRHESICHGNHNYTHHHPPPTYISLPCYEFPPAILTIFRLIWSELHVTSSMIRTKAEKQSQMEMMKKFDSRLELESQMTKSTTLW